MDEFQDQLDRRFTEMQRQLDQRFTASDKAVQAALKSAELAVNKAETAAEKRFDSVNEFRQTLSDQTKSFVTRDKFDGLADIVTHIQTKVDSLIAIGSGRHEAFQDANTTSTFQQTAEYNKLYQLRSAIGLVISGLASIISLVAVILVVVHK